MELEGLRYLLIEPVARGFLRRTHRRTGQGGQGSDQQAQRGIVNDYEGTKGLECFWGFLSLYTAGRLGETHSHLASHEMERCSRSCVILHHPTSQLRTTHVFCFNAVDLTLSALAERTRSLRRTPHYAGACVAG